MMLGPKPVRPMLPPWLLKARISVETTSPLAFQALRLKEAAMLLGPTNVVAHLYCPTQFELTQELVSVSHL